MSLVANYSSSDDDEDKEKSSDSDSDSEDSTDEKEEPSKLPLPPSLNVNLGSANSMEALRGRKTKNNSIYTNRYILEQEQSYAAISKHTSLTDKPEETSEERKEKLRQQKRKKNKPCMQFFKRGKCKYANDCRFLHSLPDNDNNTDNNTSNNTVPNYAPSISNNANVSETLKKKNKDFQNINYINNEPVEIQNEVEATDDLYWEGGKVQMKKKRPGLPENIIPSKKAMKMYKDLS